jgi:prepilin-type N-terminal cleavage/methylation domain-containing protein
MRNRSATRDPRSAIPDGFTLVELLAVMVIISIILAFVVNAGMDAQRRAQERATQGLITKLETGLSDRLEALLMTRPDEAQAHKVIAAIDTGGILIPTPTNPNQPWPQSLRASVIAWYDYVKSEMPDVFFIQSNTGPYPFNFAANSYPGTPTDPNGLGNYILPLGNSIAAPMGDGNGSGYSPTTSLGLANNPAGSGIYGASYPIAAGLYKNLGYLPQGYDTVDNNGNGLIDEWVEGVNSTNQAQVSANLGNHNHVTARSEMLYAILVEGRGPLGSIFNRDDFTDREVQDTDQDGMPEFVDAWGQPLQFFRWPLLYHSDIQRGQLIVQTNTGGTTSWTLDAPYLTAFQEREQNPLDLNQQLMAPAWWSNTYNNTSFLGLTSSAGQLGASGSAQAFEHFFRRLTEPYPAAGGPTFWDRGGSYGGRRAFYSKFLILSGGLDQQLGVFLYSDAALTALGTNGAPTALIANENNALPFALTSQTGGVADFTVGPNVQKTISFDPSLDPTNPSSSDLLQAAQDDISNQNIQVTIGIGGSG